MRRSLLLPTLPLIALAFMALGSNASLPTTSASATGQCNIRLLIPQNYERTAIEIEDAGLSLQGSGPLNPFIIVINGESATPSPILSGCFDVSLGIEARRPDESRPLEMLVEPI